MVIFGALLGRYVRSHILTVQFGDLPKARFARKERSGERTAFLYLFEFFAGVTFGNFVAGCTERLPDLAALPVGSDIVSSGLAMPIDMLSTSFYPGGFSRGCRLG